MSRGCYAENDPAEFKHYGGSAIKISSVSVGLLCAFTIFLASSSKLPTGLYILLALISFFLFFFFFFYNGLRIRWTDFRNLFTE